MTYNKKIIAVDFDGTICEDRFDWWKIGKLKPYAKQVLTEMNKRGYIIVLFTLRDQIIDPNRLHLIAPPLLEALSFLKMNDMDFFKLPRDLKYPCWKIPYSVIIDDRNTGGFTWKAVAKEFKIELEREVE